MRLTAPQLTLPHALVWEECACLLCGGTRFRPLLEAGDALAELRFLVVRCKECDLAFTNPRPDADSIAQFYPDDYQPHQSKEGPRSPGPAQLPAPFGSARLLDFGCGAGGFLRRMQRHGWNVVGLDRSDAAIARVRALGLPAHVSSLPCPLWTEASFEVITMWQSLEHVHQPLETLEAAHRLLAPGGRLIVAVPNFDSLASRWFGPHWFGLDLPRHLTHFTPKTLRAMLHRAGFEQVDIQQEKHNSWMRHSAERAGRKDAMTRFLGTRLGSGIAGWWGQRTERAECLVATAIR